jgi:hypothetical protein
MYSFRIRLSLRKMPALNDYERDTMTASTGRRQSRLLHRQRHAYRVRTAVLLSLCMLPLAAVLAAPSVFATGVTRYDLIELGAHGRADGTA